MSFVFSVAIFPLLLALLLATSIWKWKGKEWPIRAGFLIFILLLISSVVYYFVFYGFFYLGIGILVVAPAFIMISVGLIFFLIGLAKGGRQASANLKKVAKLILEDPHR